MIKGIYPAFPLVAFLAFGAQGAPVVLSVQEGGVGNTSYVTDIGFSLVSTEFGGTIYADVTIDPVSGKPQTFRFLEGEQLTYSNGSTTFTPTTFPPPNESYEFAYMGLGSQLSTKPGGGAVDQTTCRLTQSEHEIELNMGSIRFRYYVFNILIFESTQDYSQEPTSSDTRGTTTVTADLLNSGVVEDRYLVTVTQDSTHSEDVVLFEDDPVLEPVALSVDESGGFTATGEVLVPSLGLSQWVVASGGATPGDASDLLGSVPVGILYSLGLPIGEDEIPWTLDPNTGTATLNIPATGTRADLVIETSDDLENWSQQPLASGTVGSLLITLPVGHTFLRLAMPGA